MGKKLNNMRTSKRKSTLGTLFIFIIVCSVNCCKPSKDMKKIDVSENGMNVKVFYEKDKYAGWPANWGAWNWGDEILVGFTLADHLDKSGHTYDQKSSFAKFARSLDGGRSWSIEDAYENGIVGATFEHNLGDRSKESTKIPNGMDFLNPEFALTFRMGTERDGPTSFYYSYNKGKSWDGPYNLMVDFGERKPLGIVSRTDYIIDSSTEMTAFLTVGFQEGEMKWREVACMRTIDGGITWNHLSWIGEERVNSGNPASIRLGPSRILAITRTTKPPRMLSFVSEDNGNTWIQLADPVKVDKNGNPPALLRLKDGRLSLAYGIRESETMPNGIGIYISYSSDEGKTWSDPKLVRGGDGANWDIGYPRTVLLPDGKVVAMYYYNHANKGDKYRYIAATLFEPK
ncbi:sialidase family protein [Arenibacter palladensis]|nr:sialidase family protein [Arenibacter palladensis]